MLHFDAAAVQRALPWAALIPALRQAFMQGCEVPPRHVHAIATNSTDATGATDGTALLMPAWRPGGSLGVKTVTIFPGNGALGLPAVHAVYTLFSASTGVPLAVMDGSELTARRTAAASALAASMLARPHAQRLVLVGAGRVAALVPAAFRTVLPGLLEVQVWSRQARTASALAQSLREQGFTASATTDLQGAVQQADVISCATLATQALVHGAWLQPGAHLDLIGSFTPSMCEADSDCFARSRVYVDTEEALAKAGDVLRAIAKGAFTPGALQGTLATLCPDPGTGRRTQQEITLFKSVGTAREDLAAAEQVLAAADNPRSSA